MSMEDRPKPIEKTKAEYIKKKEADLQNFDMKHYREMPDFEKKEAVVKLTTAAIVREAN